MPIALRPGKRAFKVFLDSDEETPEPERPAFLCRVLTCEQFLEFGEAVAAAEATKDGFQVVRAVFGGLRAVLTGWENMTASDAETAAAFSVELPTGAASVPIPYRPEHLEKLLAMEEAKELLNKGFAGGIGAAEKKE